MDNPLQFNPLTETVFYCASGKRSAEAVKTVKKTYSESQMYSLDGGLKKWLEESA